MRALFICKKRLDTYGVSFGLLNSATFVSQMLNNNGIDSKVISVIDNNCIDREVHSYKPTHVFIEAIWVVPTKFKILTKLHPKITWIVRIHSKLPFLANEGMAINWIRGYDQSRRDCGAPYLGPNSRALYDSFSALDLPSVYLPNVYVTANHQHKRKEHSNIIDVGCFGAIRPFKNVLNQAIGAIVFAKRQRKLLRFHINGNRIEQKGEENYRNLKAVFKGSIHSLVEHNWVPHHDFLKIIRQMDLGMQVSFTESFNIVAADFVDVGVPCIGSPDIDWMPADFQADPNSVDDIAKKLGLTYHFGHSAERMAQSLNKYCKEAASLWLSYLKK